MKNSKKLAVFAIAATAASFSAGAATNASAGPATSNKVFMGITNATGGCARVYANNAQYDVQARDSTLIAVAPNHNYMASVFKGRCGGAAVKNVWFRTPGSGQVQWTIR